VDKDALLSEAQNVIQEIHQDKRTDIMFGDGGELAPEDSIEDLAKATGRRTKIAFDRAVAFEDAGAVRRGALMTVLWNDRELPRGVSRWLLARKRCMR
jgi:hypothetical protein